ncbi:MAG: YdbH domain-containing protein [Alphaproteobacteria bacterium]|nr:YdbH domain-containing protein [Alphaproteobacteria bacterium SS10]
MSSEAPTPSPVPGVRRRIGPLSKLLLFLGLFVAGFLLSWPWSGPHLIRAVAPGFLPDGWVLSLGDIQTDLGATRLHDVSLETSLGWSIKEARIDILHPMSLKAPELTDVRIQITGGRVMQAPVDRVEPADPFEPTGIDLTNPLQLLPELPIPTPGILPIGGLTLRDLSVGLADASSGRLSGELVRGQGGALELSLDSVSGTDVPGSAQIEWQGNATVSVTALLPRLEHAVSPSFAVDAEGVEIDLTIPQGVWLDSHGQAKATSVALKLIGEDQPILEDLAIALDMRDGFGAGALMTVSHPNDAVALDASALLNDGLTVEFNLGAQGEWLFTLDPRLLLEPTASIGVSGAVIGNATDNLSGRFQVEGDGLGWSGMVQSASIEAAGQFGYANQKLTLVLEDTLNLSGRIQALNGGEFNGRFEHLPTIEFSENNLKTGPLEQPIVMAVNAAMPSFFTNMEAQLPELVCCSSQSLSFTGAELSSSLSLTDGAEPIVTSDGNLTGTIGFNGDVTLVSDLNHVLGVGPIQRVSSSGEIAVKSGEVESDLAGIAALSLVPVTPLNIGYQWQGGGPLAGPYEAEIEARAVDLFGAPALRAAAKIKPAPIQIDVEIAEQLITVDQTWFGPGSPIMPPSLAGWVTSLTGAVNVTGNGSYNAEEVAASGALSVSLGELGLAGTSLEQLELKAPLTLSGTVERPLYDLPITARFDQWQLGEGIVASDFSLQGKLEPSRFRFDGADFDLFGGRILIEPLDYRLDFNDQIETTLRVDGLNLDKAEQVLGTDSTSLQGQLTGDVIIQSGENGITLREGAFNSSNGILSYKSDVPLGATAEQAALAFDVLENFHYDSLDVALEGALGGEQMANLRLAGRNPDIYDGYPINLNINLSGTLDAIARRSLDALAIPDRLVERLQQR